MLVLDTQVVLEGQPLEELPWNELDGSGPILLLCTPKMLSEVDSRKRDGRVGPRARQFNRLIDKAIGHPGPVTVADGPPRVDIALIATHPIDWSTLGDLDKDEGDDRIIAEALSAQVSDVGKLTVLSYDARPRAAASRHGLSTIKPPEAWILQPEPGPQEKENQRLKQRLRELETEQPALRVEVSTAYDSPLKLVAVRPLSPAEVKAIAKWYLELNPPYGDSGYVMMRDFSYDRLYDEFETKVEHFGDGLATALEQLFNQTALDLLLRVEGSLAATHVDVQATAKEGLLHDRLVMGPVVLPAPPEYEPGRHLLPSINRTLADVLPARVSRHEVTFDPPASRGATVRLACEDFRHGRVFRRRLYLTPDPSSSSPVRVEVVATAGNLKGRITTELELPFEVEEVGYDELVDLAESRLKRGYPLMSLAKELAQTNNLEELDSSALN